MLDHLEKTDDTDLIEATSFFTIVQGVSTKAQYREIGGIDKRLTTLRSKFQHLEGLPFNFFFIKKNTYCISERFLIFISLYSSLF